MANRVQIEIAGNITLDDNDAKRKLDDLERRQERMNDPRRKGTIGGGGPVDDDPEAEALATAAEEARRERDQARRQLEEAQRANRARAEHPKMHVDTGREALDRLERLRQEAPPTEPADLERRRAEEQRLLREAQRSLVSAMREDEPNMLVGRLRARLITHARSQSAPEGDDDTAPGGDATAARYARNAATSVRIGMATAENDKDLDRLQRRVTGGRVAAELADDDELVTELDDLNDSLAKLREELSRNREATAENTDAVGRDTGSPLGDALEGQGEGALAQSLGRALGGGRFGGTVGRMLGGLLGSPALMALGIGAAGVAAFNAASAGLQRANAPAREEISGFADLGRQYDVREDLLDDFRTQGATNERFRRLGYTATEAARVAAMLDRPRGGKDEMLDDTEAVLGFARGTGLDEGQVATATRALQLGTGGSASDALRVLRVAIAEGFTDGVASSDTMSALVEYSRQNASQGKAIGEAALAAQSLYLGNLAGTGSTSLTGPMGNDALRRMQAGITGEADEGMAYLLNRAVMQALDSGALTLGQLGFEGQEETGIRRLLDEDPLYGAELIRRNAENSPEVMAVLARTLDTVVGDSARLTAWLAESWNLSPQQIAALIADDAPFSDVFDAARGPRGDTTDAQGGNAIALRNDALGVLRDDTSMQASYGKLGLTDSIETLLTNIQSDWVDLTANVINVDGRLLQAGDTSGDYAAGMDAFFNPAPRTPPGPRQYDPDAVAQYGPARHAGQRYGSEPAAGDADPTSLASRLMPVSSQHHWTNRHGTNPNEFHNGPDGHRGVDLVGDANTPITAPYDGVIEQVGHSETLGLFVRIRGESGMLATFGHMSAVSPHLASGDPIPSNTIIGYMGNTGSASTGPHLHYQLQDPEGEYVDPEAYDRLLHDTPQRFGQGFAAGGYTGTGHYLEPAGVVHKGEFVWDADTTSKYLPLLQSLQAGGGAPAEGGTVRVLHEHAGGIRVEGVSDELARRLQAIYQRADEQAGALMARDPGLTSRLQGGGVR